MKRVLIGAGIVYAALMGFCAFGAVHMRPSMYAELRPYVWLLGPSANLVYGTNFLLPFIAGTAALAGCLLAFTRGRGPPS